MENKHKETPQDRYHKKNMVCVSFRLTKSTDADILKRLEAQDNKAGYIKRLIRQDIARSNPTDQ